MAKSKNPYAPKKKPKLSGAKKIASRSAAAKKAWATRRKLYGASGTSKKRKPMRKGYYKESTRKAAIAKIRKALKSRR